MAKYLWLLVFLVLPSFGWAATGDDCKDNLTIQNKTGVQCKILCDYPGTDTSCSKVQVPLTTTACHTFVYIRDLTGTTPHYDDWQVTVFDTTGSVTGQIGSIIGVLDDDGTVTAGLCPGGGTSCGSTLIDIFGSVMPVMQLVAGTTSGTTPDFRVYLVQYECSEP